MNSTNPIANTSSRSTVPLDAHPSGQDAKTQSQRFAQGRCFSDLAGVSQGVRDENASSSLQSTCNRKGVLGFSDLMSNALKSCQDNIQQSKHAPLAQAAVDGCSQSRDFIEDAGVAEVALKALDSLLAPANGESRMAPNHREALRERISVLRGRIHDLCEPASKLLRSDAAYFKKHEGVKHHADRTAYALKGSKLSKDYNREASRLTTDIMRLTESIQERLGKNKHEASWGQFLFDTIVKETTLPAIGLHENCTAEKAWDHVDIKAHDNFRKSCEAFNPNSDNDPFGFVCMHLGQALTIHKRDVFNSKGSPGDNAAHLETPEQNVAQSPTSVHVGGDTPSIPNEADGFINLEHRPVTTQAKGEFDTSPAAASNIDARNGGVVNSTIIGGDVVISGDTNITINLCPDLFHMDHIVEMGQSNGADKSAKVFNSQMDQVRAAVMTTLDAITSVRSHRPSNNSTHAHFHTRVHRDGGRGSDSISKNGPGRMFRDVETVATRPVVVRARSNSLDDSQLTRGRDLENTSLSSAAPVDSSSQESSVELANHPTAQQNKGLNPTDNQSSTLESLSTSTSTSPSTTASPSTSTKAAKQAQVKPPRGNKASKEKSSPASSVSSTPDTKLINLLGSFVNDKTSDAGSAGKTTTADKPAMLGTLQRSKSLEEVSAAVKAAVRSVGSPPNLAAASTEMPFRSGTSAPILQGNEKSPSRLQPDDGQKMDISSSGNKSVEDRPTSAARKSSGGASAGISDNEGAGPEAAKRATATQPQAVVANAGVSEAADVVANAGVSEAADVVASARVPEAVVAAAEADAPGVLMGTAATASPAAQPTSILDRSSAEDSDLQNLSAQQTPETARQEAMRISKPLKRVSQAMRSAVEVVEAQQARLKAATFKADRGVAVASNSPADTGKVRKPWAELKAQSQSQSTADSSSDAVQGTRDNAKYAGKKWDVVAAPLGRGRGVKPGSVQPRPTPMPIQRSSAMTTTVPMNQMLLTSNSGRRFNMRSSHVTAANPTPEMQASWKNGAPRPARETKAAWK